MASSVPGQCLGGMSELLLSQTSPCSQKGRFGRFGLAEARPRGTDFKHGPGLGAHVETRIMGLRLAGSGCPRRDGDVAEYHGTPDYCIVCWIGCVKECVTGALDGHFFTLPIHFRGGLAVGGWPLFA